MLTKLIVVLAALVAAASATEILLTQNPLNLVYRAAPAGSAREPISATLSLDCHAGNGNSYELIVSAVDSFLRAEKSYIQVVDRHGNQIRVEGRGELRFTGALSDLTVETREKNCDGTGAARCGAVRKGRIAVRQLIEVPGSGSKLYWPGFYDVDFECRLAPLDPTATQLGNSGITVPPGEIEQCIQTTHNGTITPVDDAHRVSLDLRQTKYLTMLDSCSLNISNAAEAPVIVPFLQNGIIQNVPQMSVTGRSVDPGKQYELTIRGLSLPAPEPGTPLNARVNCHVAYCRAEDSSNLAVPPCPKGALPRAAASRSLFKNFRSNAVVNSVDVNLALGEVTLVVFDSSQPESGSGAGRSSGRTMRTCSSRLN